MNHIVYGSWVTLKTSGMVLALALVVAVEWYGPIVHPFPAWLGYSFLATDEKARLRLAAGCAHAVRIRGSLKARHIPVSDPHGVWIGSAQQNQGSVR